MPYPVTQPRVCYYIPHDAYTPGKGWSPSRVTEHQYGHSPSDSIWGQSKAQAETRARKENQKLGLSRQDVIDILISSLPCPN